MNFNKIYKNNSKVWGKKPNKLLQKIYGQIDSGSEFLDLGSGQGRDSLFMLQKGFKVTAVDKSQEGIKSIKESIQVHNLPIANIDLYCEDIVAFKIKKNRYALINVINSLQFLSKKDALQIISKIKQAVKNQGYIIISSFTAIGTKNKKMTFDSCFFEPQELKKLFSDFNIIFYDEREVLDKGHPENLKPHKHNIVNMIAQKNISFKRDFVNL
jgi:tellurite methyltransferase